MKKEIPAIIQFADELYREAFSAVKKMHDNWVQNYDYFNGQHWKDKERPQGAHMVTANLFYNLIQSSIAHMTSARPVVRFVPLVSDAAGDAEFLNCLTPILWEEVDVTTVLRDMLQDATLCQAAYAQRYFDPDLNNYMGGYSLKSRDPFTCFPDPNCKEDLHKDCDWFITAENVPLSKIRQRYGDKADDIKEDLTESADERRERRFGPIIRDKINPDIFRAVGSTTVFAPGNQDALIGEEISREKVTLKTLYLKDRFAKAQFRFMRKYHNEKRRLENQDIYTKWRIITYADRTVLADTNSPFFDGELPFVQFKTQKISNNLWGGTEAQQLIPLQDTYNMTLSLILDNIERTSNPRTFYSPQAGIKKHWLSNFFRRNIPVRGRAADAVWSDRPQQLGQEAIIVLQEIPHIMESIIAQPEILQGIRPAGARSGEALKQLAYQAMPRTNQKLLRFEESIKKLVEKMILDYMSGLPEAAVRRIEGNWMEFYPADFMEAMVKVEIIPGSSMSTYQDEKVQKIAAIANAMQGLDPRLQQIILEQSGIPELRDLSDLGGAMPAGSPSAQMVSMPEAPEYGGLTPGRVG
jgi:hypothetical protein